MPDIRVRPLAVDEDELWIAAGTASDGEAETQERRRLAERAAQDARCFLVARRGDDVVARLRGTFLRPALYVIEETSVRAEGAFDDAASAFARFLAASFVSDGIGLISTDRPATAALNDVLVRSGFVLTKQKLLVGRSLDGYRAPHDDPFTYRSLADVGEDEFLRLLTESAEGDPFEDMQERDPRADFQELLDYAGAKFDATWWQIAYLDGAPVGVVLPQVFPKVEDEGTLFYIGIRPAFRGRGFGRLLHASGLGFLAAHGVARYLGSTDTRNVAMVKVMKANGCEPSVTQLFYDARS